MAEGLEKWKKQERNKKMEETMGKNTRRFRNMEKRRDKNKKSKKMEEWAAVL